MSPFPAKTASGSSASKPSGMWKLFPQQQTRQVVVEDLQVRNMSQSAAGTAENPGKQVAQKSGLNKAILDQGWGEFRRQLDYKMAWKGGMLFAVPPHHTSQTCPCCGHVSKDNRQTQARFACVECGYENHADHVGAVNILERGHRLSACGDAALSRSVKQEPTEGVKPDGLAPVGIPYPRLLSLSKY